MIKRPQELTEKKVKNLRDGRGTTTMYHLIEGKENTVILTILSRRQFIQLKQYIKKADPEAFITVSPTTEVLGKGFVNLLE